MKMIQLNVKGFIVIYSYLPLYIMSPCYIPANLAVLNLNAKCRRGGVGDGAILQSNIHYMFFYS